MLLLGLTTGNKLGLGLIAGAFIVFALVVAMLIPRYRPDFPSKKGLVPFLLATVVLFVATLAAVEIFAKEKKEPPGGEKTALVAPR